MSADDATDVPSADARGSRAADEPAEQSVDASLADSTESVESTESTESTESVATPEFVEPTEAFGALADENRLAAVRVLGGADGALSFSALFEAAPADTTAGFAYHLRQLDGRFVWKVEDGGDANGSMDAGYRLTDAGRRAARAVASGAFTHAAGFDPVAVGDPCPLCGGDLLAAGRDNVVTVACGDCERPVLRLPFPPSGHAAESPAAMLSAFDRHHRGRVSSMTDGVCPDCGAGVEPRLARAPGRLAGHLPDDAPTPVLVRFDCDACGLGLHCPVTLATIDHPAVVSFYHDHARDVRDCPIWNVGDEWRETVVSDDPWCVQVSVTLDGETLSLYVDGDLDVAGTRRAAS
jgi:hypothetical protein